MKLLSGGGRRGRTGGGWYPAALVLVGVACLRVAAANVRVDNFHSRHLLHSEHDRYFEMLASAPQEDGVWHYNDAGAPLVNKESIVQARTMEMADDAEADAVRCCLLCLVIGPWRARWVAAVLRARALARRVLARAV